MDMQRREGGKKKKKLVFFSGSEIEMRKNTLVSGFKLKRIMGPIALKLQGLGYPICGPRMIDEEEKIDHRKIYFLKSIFFI